MVKNHTASTLLFASLMAHPEYKLNEHQDDSNPAQKVLNVAYWHWQNAPEESNMGYPEMLTFMEQAYGSDARFIVQAGKYNYQVTNGGHAQYHDNGYAHSDDPWDEDGVADLHMKLTSALSRRLSFFGETGEKVLKIMQDCKGFPLEELDAKYDMGHYELAIDSLDTRYYELDETFMELLGKFTQSLEEQSARDIALIY